MSRRHISAFTSKTSSKVADVRTASRRRLLGPELLEKRIALNAGELDFAFGDLGLAVHDFGGNESAAALVVQPDGKLLVAGSGGSAPGGGNIGLLRLEADGQDRDTSFDTDGLVLTDLPAWDNEAAADLSVVTSGSNIDMIYVAATLRTSAGVADVGLLKYDASGVLQCSQSTDFGGMDTAHALAVQEDGKVVIVGQGVGAGWVIARYNTDCSPDTSFHGDGRLTLFGSNAVAADVIADGAGFVVAGRIPGNYLTLVRFDAAGSFNITPSGIEDPPVTFRGPGYVQTTVGLSSFDARALVRDSLGGYLVAGEAGTPLFGPATFGPLNSFAVARLNADFSVDTLFGAGGVAAADFGLGLADARDVVIQPDDSIVVAGDVQSVAGSILSSDFGVARFTLDGTLDATFKDAALNLDGRVVTDFGGPVSPIDFAAAVAMQGSDRIVVAGAAGNDFGLARYIATGTAGPAPDNDNDGVIDAIENGVDGDGDGLPDGDGDQNGMPDRNESRTASLPNGVDGGYVTVKLINAIGPDAQLANVGASEIADPPANVSFPIGGLSFTITGIAPQSDATVQLHVPPTSLDTANGYFRFGPTPLDRLPHWYDFPVIDDVGAVLDPASNLVTLTFVDGQRGDDDLAANGAIVDIGGPAVVAGPPPEVSGVKFHDVNGNGQLDTGEPRLSGWTMELVDENGQTHSTITDTIGEYSFTGLPQGSARVTEVLDDQPGWYQTSPPPLQPQGHLDGPFSLTRVASGDVDGDGHLDLVGMSFGQAVSEVQVFFGSGDGSFDDGVSHDTGLDGQNAMVLADLDDDGKSELVVISEFGPNDAVVFYDLDAAEPQQVSLDVPGIVRSVAFGNADDADHQDIFLYSRNVERPDGQVLAVVNDGTRSFDGATQILVDTVDATIAGVVAGDWDGDGDDDLAVAANGMVTIYQNNFPNFDVVDAFAGGAVEAADVDDDGDLDLIGPATVLVNNGLFIGNVSFAKLDAPFPPGNMTSLQLQRGPLQRQPAVAVTDDTAHTITLFIGDGAGNFEYFATMPPTDQPGHPMLGHSPRGLTAGDFDEDGLDDLAVALFIPDEVSLLRQAFNAPYIARLGESPIVTDANFGNRSLSDGEIRGHAFVDSNRDINQNPGEANAAGAVVYLDVNNNGSVQFGIDHITEADENGDYVFTNLPPGDYTVRQSVPPDWLQTRPTAGEGHAYNVTLGQDEIVAELNFGFAPPPVIEGTLFNDLNGDSDRDPGEPPLVGWRVYLDLNNSGQFDDPDVSQLTDAQGNYRFDFDLFPSGVLPPGVYTVDAVVPNGWEQTFAGPENPLEVLHGDVRTVDFGYWQPAEIRGSLWNDLDGDRRIDPNEPPLNGWEVRLIDQDGNELNAFTTLAGGYRFSDVPPGAYTLTEVLQPGWTPTFPATNNLQPYVIQLSPGDVVENRDFGNVLGNVIRGDVWSDDGDGQREVLELALEGWIVFLDEDGDLRLDTNERFATTDADGEYSFGGVAEGEYEVTQVIPTNWRQTFPGGLRFTTETLDLEHGSYWVAVEDFNLDGNPDIASGRHLITHDNSSSTPTITVSELGFQSIYGQQMAFGRFNSDDFLDRISHFNGNYRLYPYDPLASRFATFEESILFPNTELLPFGEDMTALDINNDGLDDLIVWGINAEITPLEDEFGVWVFLNDLASPGNFTPTKVLENTGGSIVAGDVNADGETDLVFAAARVTNPPFSQSHGTIEVSINNGGTFSQPKLFSGSAQVFDHGISSFTLNDMDLDGDLDLVAITSSDFYSDPDCVPDPDDDNSCVFFDLLAVVLENHSELGTPDVFTTRSTRVFATETLTDPDELLSGFVRGPSSEGAVGDVDRDGRPDIAATSSLNDTVSIILGTSANAVLSFPSIDELSDIALADFDLDGDLDVVIRSAHAAELTHIDPLPMDVAGVPDLALMYNQGFTVESHSVTVTEGVVTAPPFGNQVTLDFNDNDGVSDFVENSGPNGGDGNGDGELDSSQDHVTSLSNAVTGDYVTLIAPEGIRLVDVQVIDPNAPDSAIPPPPPGVTLPLGLFQFTLEGVALGATVEIQMIDHSGEAGTSYYKFGATPGNPTDEWYEFDFDGTTGAQRLISPPTRPVFSLTFVNGDRGDNDGDATNSTIVDPGGPAIVSALLDGNFNGNEQVEQGDLDLVLLNWGLDADPIPSGWVNDLPTGRIDQDELDAVLLNWGESPVALAASTPQVLPLGSQVKNSPLSSETFQGARMAAAKGRALPTELPHLADDVLGRMVSPDVETIDRVFGNLSMWHGIDTVRGALARTATLPSY